jgi:TolB-like protein
LSDGVADLASQIAKHVTAEQKTRIAVLPFRELGGQSTVLGTYVSEELVTDLVNAGGFDLVERTTLDKVMGELKLDESGSIDPATAKSVGNLVGADAIVTGTITDLQSYVAINCRLIASQTGRIFAAANTKIVKDDDVKKIMGVPMGGPIPAAHRDNAAPDKPENRAQSVLTTDLYRVEADSLRKVGNDITLTLILDAKDDKPMRFYVGNCSLLDENGERWQQQGTDSGHFVQDAVTLMPGTRIKSRFQFSTNGATDGHQFTLSCSEYAPHGGRYIVLSRIPIS